MKQTNNGDYMKRNKVSNTKRIENRFHLLELFIILFFTVILYSFFKITIIDSAVYKEKLESLTETIVYGPSAPRGRIYDRNYNLLVDNKAIPVIYYKKKDKVTAKEEIELAYSLLEHIDIDSSKLLLTNLKEFWIADNPSLAKNKITPIEWQKLQNRKLSSMDIYYLQLERITDEDLSIYDEKDKDAAYVYYLMNKGYSYEEKIIKDKNISDKEYAYIAENSDSLGGFDVKYNWERVYLYGDTFRSILGSISNITKEDKDYYLSNGYSLDEVVGVSYLEKQYESILKGKKAKYKVGSNNELVLLEEGSRGNDIVLTIDINLQKEVEKILKEEIINAKYEPNTEYYNHSFVVIQQPNTGEILAMSGKQAIYRNGGYEIVDYTPEIVTSPMTAGSVVKGASMYVGYSTNAIKIGEYQKDECIKLYSVPRKCSWGNLGYIDDITALAQSSNVYQFKIAMKVANFQYSYNKKFELSSDNPAFSIYRNVFNQFGLGVKTGIDLPVESIGNVGKNDSSDLLLNFAIGQYDTYTTMQLSQYMTTIASNGLRLQPHLLKEVYHVSNSNELGELDYKVEPKILNEIENKEYLSRIQEGLKAVVSYGTGASVMGYTWNPAGKTGTSESFLDTDGNDIIDTATVSKTFAGYAPANAPKMSITVTSPDLINPNNGSDYMSAANFRIARRISNYFFDTYGYD